MFQNIYKVFFPLFFLVIHSCINKEANNNKTNAVEKTEKSEGVVNNPVDLYESPPQQILRKWQYLAFNGNKEYYQKLRFYYFKSGNVNGVDFLPYAIRMANKYNDHGANYDVYIACSSEAGSKDDFSEVLDSVTLSLIRLHLGKACMYGNKQAKEDYKRIFKESYQ